MLDLNQGILDVYLEKSLMRAMLEVTAMIMDVAVRLELQACPNERCVTGERELSSKCL